MHHNHIDRFAHGDSPVHRLDGRTKLLALVAYLAVLISFGRHDLVSLAPMAIWPAALLWLGGIPMRFALRRVVLLSPLILMLGVMSPLYDRGPMTLAAGPWQWQTTGGMLAGLTLATKFALGVLAVTAVTCTTRFSSLLESMRRLGMPSLLVMQVGMLYRYLYVLVDEAMRVRLARDFRGAALATTMRRLSAVGSIIGSLFVRTLDRSERIALAMQARGYNAQTLAISPARISGIDLATMLATFVYLLICRW